MWYFPLQSPHRNNFYVVTILLQSVTFPNHKSTLTATQTQNRFFVAATSVPVIFSPKRNPLIFTPFFCRKLFPRYRNHSHWDSRTDTPICTRLDTLIPERSHRSENLPEKKRETAWNENQNHCTRTFTVFLLSKNNNQPIGTSTDKKRASADEVSNFNSRKQAVLDHQRVFQYKNHCRVNRVNSQHLINRCMIYCFILAGLQNTPLPTRK